MDRFIGEVAIVTGSSSRIGAATSTELVKNGVIVAGLARRVDKLQELAKQLNTSKQYKGKFYPVKCDITNEDEIKSSLKWVFDNLGPVSILVNNAAVLISTYLTDVSTEMIDDSFNTNVKAVLLFSKAVIKNMLGNSIEGHIININSIAGQKIITVNPNLYMLYSSSKHALRNIYPGYVVTEFTGALVDLPPEMTSSAMYPIDIANACISALNTPPHVLISDLTVQPIHSAV